MLLEGGSAVAVGHPSDVLSTYRERTEYSGITGTYRGAGERFGDRSAEITAAWFEDGRGKRITSSEQGTKLVLVAEATFHRDMEEPNFGLHLRNEEGVVVFVASTLWSDSPRQSFEQGDRVRFAITIDNVLGLGRHFAAPAIAHRDARTLADYRIGFASVVVSGPRWTGGLVDLPHTIEVSRL